MSDAKREKLRKKIESRSARQIARANSQIAERAAEAKDRVARAANEHPLLLIAGGLAIGVAISTLIPKAPTRKLGKSAFGLIATIAELGITYGKQAYDAVGEASEKTAKSGKIKWGGFGRAKAPESTPEPLEKIPE